MHVTLIRLRTTHFYSFSLLLTHFHFCHFTYRPILCCRLLLCGLQRLCLCSRRSSLCFRLILRSERVGFAHGFAGGSRHQKVAERFHIIRVLRRRPPPTECVAQHFTHVLFVVHKNRAFVWCHIHIETAHRQTHVQHKDGKLRVTGELPVGLKRTSRHEAYNTHIRGHVSVLTPQN